jgi:hypothetical protein
MIRVRATRAYLQAGGQWSSDYRRAEHFQDVFTAVRACQIHKLRGVELVLQLGDTPSDLYDVVLPLSGDLNDSVPAAPAAAG